MTECLYVCNHMQRSVRRYWNNGDGLSNREYILGTHRVDRDRLIIWNAQCIFSSSLSPHAHLLSFRRSTQFVWFLRAGHPIIASHPLPMLSKPDPHILSNSSWMTWQFRPFTTPWCCELRNVLGGHHCASVAMHLQSEIEWTHRCISRP